MDKISEVVYKMFLNYFSNLEYLGFYADNITYNMIILSFIEDILKGKYGIIESEEDYKIIDNFLYTVYGTSCVIPYPEYIKEIQFNSDKPLSTGILRNILNESDQIIYLTSYTSRSLKKASE